MDWKDAVGYDNFKAWEKDLARIKARGLAGNYGLTRNDVDDLEAELRLHIWIKRTKYDPNRAPRVTYETFMSRVVDNKIRDIIAARRSQKRHPPEGLQSMEVPIETRDGLLDSVVDTASEDDAMWGRLRPASERSEIQLLLENALQRLSDSQKELFRLLLQGFTVTEAAEKLGRPRTTLNKEVARMRAAFGQEDLEGYL